MKLVGRGYFKINLAKMSKSRFPPLSLWGIGCRCQSMLNCPSPKTAALAVRYKACSESAFEPVVPVSAALISVSASLLCAMVLQ